MKQTTITNSVEETMNLGQKLIESIEGDVLIALKGDLGAGKTAFTKGIAKGLEIEEPITSPTFTLLKEYEGTRQLKHIDAYRLENMDSDPLALYDLMGDDAVIVIEWSEFIDDLNPDYIVEIQYISDTQREIKITGDTL